jgi:seryl-tRNA synthetase
MLDIKFIRENADLVERSAKNKGYKVNISELLALDDKRRQLTAQIDELRQQRNGVASQMKGGKPSAELVEQGKAIKTKLAGLEAQLAEIDVNFTTLLGQVPNIIADDVPIGDEADSVEIKAWGGKPTGAKDHLDLALRRDWVDFKRGAKVAGAKFYYLKGDLARLEMALLQYAVGKVYQHGFSLMDVPYLVNSRTMTGAGFAPRSSEQSDEYAIEGEDLQLIATAEIPLTGYLADEIIDEADLPLLYAGYSPCFRKEAGAAGKFGRGLFRVHQFNKVEMYVFCTPEQSPELHEKLLAVEEEIWQELKIPYRVINIASGDLGSPAYKKYDVEFWSPVDETYREVSSCSNCTDFQARNLSIRVRRADGSIETLHTLNGTAISLARALQVLLENYQSGDKVAIPEVLQKFMNNQKEI